MSDHEYPGARPAEDVGGRRRYPMAVAVLVLVAAIVAAAVWVITSSRDAVDLAAVEATSSDLVAELAAAATTAEVRTVAAAAAAQADEVRPALDDGSDPDAMAATLKTCVLKHLDQLSGYSPEELIRNRRKKFRDMGVFSEVPEPGLATG